MRWLLAGLGSLAFGLVPGLALAQEAPKLFAPAPKTAPANAPADARSIPMVPTTLKESLAEAPVPIPRPEIRPTLAEPVAQTVSRPVPEPPPTPLPRPQYQPPPMPFADGVTAQFDIAYATLPGFRPLTLDLYRPRAQAAPAPMPLPMIVFVHGGSWKNGDSRTSRAFTDFPRALAGLAAQGYVVASINYRLAQEARFPAALQDVKSAIRWMRGHAAAFNGDPTRLAVWGASAGGQIAAMAGVTCGVSHFEPDGEVGRDAPSDCAEAIIDWYGPIDLLTVNTDLATDGFAAASTIPSDEGRYVGCEPAACAPGVARQSSALSFITETAPPFLIQHGASDHTVSPKQSQKLHDALKQKGVPAQIVTYPDVGHQFMRGDTPDAATVAKAMAQVTQFLAATFPVKTKPQIRHTVAN